MEHPGEIAGEIYARPLFLLLFVFLLSRMSGFFVGWEWFFGIFGLVELGILGQVLPLFLLKFSMLGEGGELTHGDFVLGAEVDFLAVVEHRLIPARVRGEWARLRCKRLAFVRAPASQDASHVKDHAGVGIVSSRGAPLSLPSFYCHCSVSAFFLIVVGLLGVCFPWVVVGLCI